MRQMGGGTPARSLSIQDNTKTFDWADPFSMAYGVEAITAIRTGVLTIQMEYFDEATDGSALAADLNLGRRKEGCSQDKIGCISVGDSKGLQQEHPAPDICAA